MKRYHLITGVGLLLFTVLSAAEETPVPSATEETAVTTELPPIEYFDRISERPLFNASRRPKPPAEDGDPTVDGDLKGKWRLTGVVENNGVLFALFSERSGDEKLKLNVGMPLDQSGELTEIGLDYVLVDNGEDQIRFDLWEPRELPPEPKNPPPGAQSGQKPARDRADQTAEPNPSRNLRTEEKD